MRYPLHSAPLTSRGIGSYIKFLFFLFVVFYSLAGYAQVTANFTASVTSGCPPQVVSFTNTSTGATSYTWTLGNSSTPSTSTNAGTSYLAAGTYTVTLVATNGTSTDTKSIQIVIHSLPVVSFAASDTVICPGGQIAFNNTTNPMSTGGATYYWDFGDGNSSTSQNATHAYQVAGFYSVTLTATNSDGCSSSQVQSSYIHVRNKPVPNFYLANSSFCGLPAAATFTNQATGNGPLTYAWTFGDGGTSGALTPTHSYAATGVYTVKEIVTDVYGCKDSVSTTENISTNGVTASLLAPDSACINSPVSITNTSTGNFISNIWSYGDGNTYTGNNPGETYAAAGNYTIRMILYDGSCYDTVTHNIKIKPTPVVTISTVPTQPCPAPSAVQFTAIGADAGATYKWHFGDGDSSTQTSPSHLYNSNNVYIVTLNVNSFCPVAVSKQLPIYDYSHQPNLTPFSNGCAPLTVNFSFSAFSTVPPPTPPYLYPYPIHSYVINYGDGSPAVTTSTAVHTYTIPGIYHSYIATTYASGCIDTAWTDVGVGIKPIITSFSVTPASGSCRHDTITFRGKATGLEPLQYVYNLYTPPPGIANLLPISGIDDTLAKYQYTSSGTFRPYLTVFNNGCPSDTTQHLTISIDSPTALAPSGVYSCDSPLKFLFYDSSIGATTRFWMFGDGTTSTAKNPVHYYAAAGNYVPRLAVYNSTTGCRDTTDLTTVQALMFKTLILTPDTAVCKDVPDTLTGSYITSGFSPPQGYQWYVDGVIGDTSARTAIPTGVPGFHSIVLIEKDVHNCLDTGYRKIFISQPAAGFTASPLQVCVPSSVIFTDTSHDTPGAYIATRSWFFGDNLSGIPTVVSTATASHAYTSSGFYNIKEIVTDNNGCKDSVFKNAYIHAHKPTASFSAANTNHCVGDAITFVNLNPGGLTNGYWTFGDGLTANAISATHAYSAAGTYTVTLVVTDTSGCKDTMVKIAYINITKPHAAFFDNDSTGICAPLVVNLTNTSTGAATYSWVFGNTNTSVAPNPTASYSTPGNYTIQLVATDAYGCKDTAYHHIILYGNTGTFSYTPIAGCPPLNVNFTASITNIPSIVWDFNDGTVTPSSTNTTVSHMYTTPGKYLPKVILGDSAGCHASILGTDTIRIDKATAAFTETQSICINDTVHFTDISTSLFTAVTSWNWVLGDGTTSFSHNPQHSYHATGNYNVRLIVADAAGCKDTTNNTITINGLPAITAGGDTLICPGDSALLTATGGATYVWGPAASITCTTCNPTYAAPIVATAYVVTGTDAFGCKNKDTVKIGMTYKTVSYAGMGGQICIGQSIALTDSGAQRYTWLPANTVAASHSATTTATPTYNTTYLAIAQTGSCIPDTNYVQVAVNELPHVTALGAGTVTAGSKVNLQAYGPNIVSFLWSHGELLNCDDCTAPIATMQQTTTFTVTGVTQYGCEDSAHVTINVLCDKSQVFIPNTFTPNGDGENDLFYPRGIGIRVVKSFRIYNRWGQLVFERDDIQLNDEHNGWDGTFGGGKPIADTYVYAVDAICDDGQPIDWKGDVTIVR